MGSHFKSQKEIFQHLAKGGKLRKPTFESDFYIYFNEEGHLVTSDGHTYAENFSYYSIWEPHVHKVTFSKKELEKVISEFMHEFLNCGKYSVDAQKAVLAKYFGENNETV